LWPVVLFSKLGMKFFTFVSLFSVFLLSWSKPFAQDKPPAKKALPAFIKAQHRDFKDGFQSPQNANVLWAFLTGEKAGITPRAQKSFNDLELGFLFSPSGIHLSALLALFFLGRKLKIPKSRHKKKFQYLQWILLLSAYFLPYLAVKRIICLRFLMLLQRLFKKRIPIEALLVVTFLISFLFGHFAESPLGFILSFLYMGTFIGLRDQARPTILLGLFSTHLIICFFSGNEVSLISLVLNLPLIALFSFLLPFFYLYFLSFQWIHFNWIELVVRAFILMVHWMAKLTQGTFVSASLFLILAVWIILLKKQKRYLLILLLLHGNAANSPAIFQT